VWFLVRDYAVICLTQVIEQVKQEAKALAFNT